MATTTESIRSSQSKEKSLCSARFILMFALILILPRIASAAEWKVSPNLELKETYSSNVRLAPQGNDASDYITQINPGANVSGTGPHFNLSANYLMQNFVYADKQNKNSTHHLLTAGGDAEIIDEYFFIDAKSSVRQQSTSPLAAPLSLENGNIFDDRTEIRTYSLSPYVYHSFGNLLSTELRYTRDSVSSNSNELLNSNANNFLFRTKSRSAFSVAKWQIEYSKQNINYLNSSADTAHEKYFLALDYLLSSKFSLSATGGNEKYDYISMYGNPKGKFWLAGFSWIPGERTSISANGGKRFWGDTYSLTANHRARRSAWSIGYNEDISDTRTQFLMPATIDTASFLNKLWEASIPDPLIRQQLVEAFMIENGLPVSLANPVNFLTNRVFLQKRLQVSVALVGAKSTVLFSLFNVQREAQTSGVSDSALQGIDNIALSDKNKQTGVNIIWNLKASPVSTASMGVSYVKNNFQDIDQQFYTRSFTFNLIRKFKPDLNGSLGLRHVRGESKTGTDDYRENAITASMQKVF